MDILNASGATASVDGTAIAVDELKATVACSALGSIAGAGLFFTPAGVTTAQKRRAFRILLDNLSTDLDLSTFAKREAFGLKRSQEDLKFIAEIIKADTGGG